MPEKTFEDGVVDHAERSAVENMKIRQEQAVFLLNQATTTLTVLLAGVGGAMTLGAKAFAPGVPTPQPFEIACAWMSGYLALLAMATVLTCLRVRAFPMVFNEPRHLAVRGVALEDIRSGDLANMQRAIDRAIERNARISRYLNGIRLGACATPLLMLALMRYYS